MKRAALLIALTVGACSPPPDEVDSIQQAYTCPGDSYCSRLIVHTTFTYDIDWDAVLAYGNSIATQTMASRQVTSASAAMCPAMWLLICSDAGCANPADVQTYNLSAWGVTLKRMQHYPGALEYSQCEYKLSNTNYNGQPIGYSIKPGHKFIWFGYQCAGGFAPGGDTGINHGEFDVPIGTYTTAEFGIHSFGPYSDKVGWKRRFDGCSGGPSTGDSAWTSSLPLSMSYCEAAPPNYSTCLSGSTHQLYGTW